MPDTWPKSVTYVWEIFSGISDDKNSKIARLVIFAVLLLGIVFAGFAYYKAELPFNIRPKNAVRLQFPQIIDDRQRVNNLLAQSQKLTLMRNSAITLAGSMATMNRRLFTDDIANLPELKVTGLTENHDNNNINDNIPLDSEGKNVDSDGRPDITINGIIISQKNHNRAVIETNGRKGILVKAGDKVPDTEAKITNINSKGLKLKVNGKTFDYLFTPSK